jgi:cytochrome oxidase Cu insertion factor (SCO1/SenC/PrrC family)
MRRPRCLPLVLAGLALSLAGCAGRGEPAPALDDLGPVGDFTFTERSGKPVRRADLLGKVWVAGFTFTCCTTHCPQVSGSLARLQKELEGHDGVLLVSFSVDPEYDTPAVLREYAERYGADPARWLMLTGKQDEIHELIRKSFFLAAEPNKSGQGDKVTHSPRLCLVDRRGRFRGYFDGRQVDEQGEPINDLPRLKQAALTLLREGP